MTLTEVRRFDLKSLRRSLNWSQAQLSSALGCSLEDVSLWEARGRCPDHLQGDAFAGVAFRLLKLRTRVEENTERTRLSPVTEQEMKDLNLEQVEIKRVA